MTTGIPKPRRTSAAPARWTTRPGMKRPRNLSKSYRVSGTAGRKGPSITNVETGEYYDKTKVHSLDHVGKFYSVRGPLNLTRTPQGQPVLVQAGASEDGQKFASQFAEMIFAVQLDKEHAKEFYATMKAKVAGWGRNPEHCKILPGFMPIVGRDEQDARAEAFGVDAPRRPCCCPKDDVEPIRARHVRVRSGWSGAGFAAVKRDSNLCEDGL